MSNVANLGLGGAVGRGVEADEGVIYTSRLLAAAYILQSPPVLHDVELVSMLFHRVRVVKLLQYD